MAPSRRSPTASQRSRTGAGRRAGARLDRLILGAVAAAALIVGGVLVAQRITQVQQGAVTPDVPQGSSLAPALRARGAVISISGEGSRPQASYDPASGTVLVRFQSKYYDPSHSAALNRQWIATEGRLVVQLALYNAPEVARAVAELYHGRQQLVTVTGTPDQAYAAYTVQYAKGLP